METEVVRVSYKYEFPDFDRELYVPEGWMDNSWHNDIMPRAIKRTKNEEIEISIWQDYENVDRREYDNGKRYIFQIQVGYDTIFSWETDDLDEIKKLVEAVEIP